ncbi:MAG: OPT/YSL family transporter [Planctomycetes bacterium]|nr:OPT/YSL family transporter [Planctomycetota bacterium]
MADEDAVATWDGWSNEQRDDALAAIKSKPGFLSGLNPHLRAALIALIGTLWIWLAGIIIAQCTGMTDWSPVSGIALLTVVLVMFLAGTGNVIAAVLVGATLCCAITMASDMMADLRTGYIVGASPRKQQIVELCTTWIGPVVCMMTILLISSVNMKQYGVPMGAGTPTEAPQAQALQAVINGVQGGDMPYALYAMGALLGAMLGLGAFAGLGVLVGLSMYLPFIYISTYGIGCIANIVIGKIKGRSWAEEWGVPLAAGLIVGEAILSLIVSGIVLAKG